MSEDTNTTLAYESGDSNSLHIDQKVALAISFSIALLACIANATIVYLTKKCRQFHVPAIYVRAAYAILDFLSAAIIILHVVLGYFGVPKRVSCWLANVASGLFFASIQLTAFIAIERYFYFCEPMKYPRYFTLRSIASFTVLVISVAEAYMIYTEIAIGRIILKNFGICHLSNQPLNRIFQLCFFFLPAMICTSLSVYKIGKLILKNRRAIGENATDKMMKIKIGRKALRLINVIYLFYLVLFILILFLSKMFILWFWLAR